MFFVSHRHKDHYNSEIFDWEKEHPNILYILSDDVEAEPAPNRIFVKPEQKIRTGELKVEKLRSTDEGVAFLVTCKDKRIYHAGDLNWWHWEEEEEPFNRMMRRNYQREIDKLDHMEIDAAFVPVDPRLGEQYCWGLDYFMRQTRTKMYFRCIFGENMKFLTGWIRRRVPKHIGNV